MTYLLQMNQYWHVDWKNPKGSHSNFSNVIGPRTLMHACQHSATVFFFLVSHIWINIALDDRQARHRVLVALVDVASPVAVLAAWAVRCGAPHPAAVRARSSRAQTRPLAPPRGAGLAPPHQPTVGARRGITPPPPAPAAPGARATLAPGGLSEHPTGAGVRRATEMGERATQSIDGLNRCALPRVGHQEHHHCRRQRSGASATPPTQGHPICSPHHQRGHRTRRGLLRAACRALCRGEG